MKRRDFLRSAGAAAVLPVLPLPALAAPAAAAPVNAMQVGWAALYARANHRATPALLQKWLRIDSGQANAMMSELVKRNVIHAPIAGSATAVQPMYSAQNVGGLFGSKRKALETAKDVLEGLIDEDQSDLGEVDVQQDEADTLLLAEPEHASDTRDAPDEPLCP